MNDDQNKRDYRPKNHIPRDYTPHPDDWEEKAKPPVPRMSVDGGDEGGELPKEFSVIIKIRHILLKLLQE